MNIQATPQVDNRFRVGNPVYFIFGKRRLKGFVVEDRGAIGVGGRRLYRIEAPIDAEAPLVLELSADELQPA